MSETVEKKALVPKLRFPKFSGQWNASSIGSETKIYKGRGISKAEVDPNGKIFCIRYGELYTRYGEIIDEPVSKTASPAESLFFSEAEDVIVPSSGETKEDIATAACVLRKGIALGGDLNILRSPHDGRWLSYYLRGKLRGELAKVAQGDSVVHLYPDQIARVSIAVPANSEQRKIADCLQSLDELIAAQTEKLEGLKRHKKGLLQQLFPSEGETTPRLRFPQFRGGKEWKQVSLGDICALISGQHLAPDQYDVSGKIPYFSGPSDLTNDPNHIQKWVDESNNTGKKEDILVTVKGSGAGGVWMLLLDEVAIGRQLMAVRATKCDGRFVFQYLLTQIPRLSAMATGNLIPGLSRPNLLTLSLPLPEKEEQSAIAGVLNYIDEMTQMSERGIEKLSTHKAALMQQLFPHVEELDQ